jgi:hypothetical protein
MSAALYPEYRTWALAIGNAASLTLEQLKPKHLVALSKAYGLSTDVLSEAVADLDRRRRAADGGVTTAAKRIGEEALGKDLLDLMERRWNGSFKSIGQFLSKKPSGDAGE